ncbi:MAG TPA: hypothetical protein VHF47_13490 [Acidimicrobiales bacterium]|nr:hypothetical protein [Acidimicrobiales bacterium]
MQALVFCNVLFRHIGPTMRAELRVPNPPSESDGHGWKAVYRNVRTRLHGILELVDPSPYPKNRRLDAAAFAERTKDLSADEIAERIEKLTWLANRIIEASLRECPAEILDNWDGSIGLDATPIRLYARPERRARGRRGKQLVEVHSSDPDGAWYMREHDHRDPDTQPDTGAKKGKQVAKAFWAQEATIATASSSDPRAKRSFPKLAVGMASLHKPGHHPDEHGIRALASIKQRGHPSGLLAADRAYTNSKPENFQLPARAMGYRLVLDYREDQLGIQGSHAGALQIEGGWSCPCLPEALVDATADFRAGGITEDVWRQRLRARTAYRLREKERPDAEGHVRLQCPAAGPAPTCRCPLKPASVSDATAGKPLVLVTDDVAQNPPAICRQQSVTFPPDAGAKYLQALEYESPDWRRAYPTLRNSIEGTSGTAKDGAYEALGIADRRRIRGQAAQTLFVAFLLFGTNLRMIDSFRAQAKAEEDGVMRLPRKRRRKTRPLSDHLPTTI